MAEEHKITGYISGREVCVGGPLPRSCILDPRVQSDSIEGRGTGVVHTTGLPVSGMVVGRRWAIGSGVHPGGDSS